MQNYVNRCINQAYIYCSDKKVSPSMAVLQRFWASNSQTLDYNMFIYIIYL